MARPARLSQSRDREGHVKQAHLSESNPTQINISKKKGNNRQSPKQSRQQSLDSPSRRRRLLISPPPSAGSQPAAAMVLGNVALMLGSGSFPAPCDSLVAQQIKSGRGLASTVPARVYSLGWCYFDSGTAPYNGCSPSNRNSAVP